MHNQPLSTIITLLFLLSSSLFLSSSSSSLRTSVINTDESGPNNDDNDDKDLKTTPILEDSIVDTSIDNSPTGEAEDPVEIARIRSERSMPTGLQGQDWFWKKLGKVTSEIKSPVVPEFKVEVGES